MPAPASAAAAAGCAEPVAVAFGGGEILERRPRTAGYDTTYGAGILDGARSPRATTAPGHLCPDRPRTHSRPRRELRLPPPVGNDNLPGAGGRRRHGAREGHPRGDEPRSPAHRERLLTLADGPHQGHRLQPQLTAGKTVANLTVVKLGIDGRSTYNHSGFTHVIADVVGWFSDGSTAVRAPVSTRWLRRLRRVTRRSTRRCSRSQTSGINVQVIGQGGVPAVGQVSAVVLNVTADQPSDSLPDAPRQRRRERVDVEPLTSPARPCPTSRWSRWSGRQGGGVQPPRPHARDPRCGGLVRRAWGAARRRASGSAAADASSTAATVAGR